MDEVSRKQKLYHASGVLFNARATLDLIIELVRLTPIPVANQSLQKGDVIRELSAADAMLGKLYSTAVEEHNSIPEEPEA